MQGSFVFEVRKISAKVSVNLWQKLDVFVLGMPTQTS